MCQEISLFLNSLASVITITNHLSELTLDTPRVQARKEATIRANLIVRETAYASTVIFFNYQVN